MNKKYSIVWVVLSLGLLGFLLGTVYRAMKPDESAGPTFKVGTEEVSVYTAFPPQSGVVESIKSLSTQVGKIEVLEVCTRNGQVLAVPPAPGQNIAVGDRVELHFLMIQGRAMSMLAFNTTNITSASR